ncbi:MAG: glycosyltransferase [Nanoarchaeota archaeon]
MILSLLVLQIITLIIIFTFLLFSISNIWSLGRLGDYKQLKEYPNVSIIVPARDEERNIKRCVDSLLKQDYPNYEVLVLNDNSTDQTEEILKGYKDEKFKYFNGKPLPEDWLGKHWACHQLTEKASGKLLLFIDADTYHKPNALRASVEAMYEEKADFITALPREKARSLSEKFIIPIIGWSMVTFIPFAIAKRSKMPSLSATIGQYMLFRKEAYLHIGGYPAIRKEVLDDVTFGRRIKSFGLKWRMFDGTKLIHCRMYHNFHEIFDGFTRYIFAIFKNNIFYFLFSILILIFVLLSPWIIAFLYLFGENIGEVSFILSMAAILISYLTWLISNSRFKYSHFLTLLHPLIIIFVSYIAFSSMIKTFSGKIEWKGRPIKIFK